MYFKCNSYFPTLNLDFSNFDLWYLLTFSISTCQQLWSLVWVSLTALFSKPSSSFTPKLRSVSGLVKESRLRPVEMGQYGVYICIYIYIYIRPNRDVRRPDSTAFWAVFSLRGRRQIFFWISRSICFLRFQPIKCIRLKSIWRANFEHSGLH